MLLTDNSPQFRLNAATEGREDLGQSCLPRSLLRPVCEGLASWLRAARFLSMSRIIAVRFGLPGLQYDETDCYGKRYLQRTYSCAFEIRLSTFGSLVPCE